MHQQTISSFVFDENYWYGEENKPPENYIPSRSTLIEHARYQECFATDPCITLL